MNRAAIAGLQQLARTGASFDVVMANLGRVFDKHNVVAARNEAVREAKATGCSLSQALRHQRERILARHHSAARQEVIK